MSSLDFLKECRRTKAARFSFFNCTRIRTITFLSFGFALTAGCTTVAITGRPQVNVVSDSTVIAAADASFDSLMRLATQKGVIVSERDSPTDRAAIAQVQRVLDRLVERNELRGMANWQATVLRSPVPNALVMPNGQVVVFSGLLSVTKGDAGLAAVLGHEIGHVFAKHRSERLSQQLLANGVVNLAQIALTIKQSAYAPIAGAALGFGAQYGLLLPFGRAHESEADRLGQLFMAKAGYDPQEAIHVWERMQTGSASNPWEFVSTHPSHATRIAQLTEWLPQARTLYEDPRRPLPSRASEIRVADVSATKGLPVGVRPDTEVGFWFRLRSTSVPNSVTYRLTSVYPCGQDTCRITEGDDGSRALNAVDGGVLELRSRDGSLQTFSPGLKSMEWPIRVGSSFEQPLKVTRGTVTTEFRHKVEVVGFERVTVPAGSFFAYRMIQAINGVRTIETWYSTDARCVVKQIQYDAQGRQSMTRELEAYHQPIDVQRRTL